MLENADFTYFYFILQYITENGRLLYHLFVVFNYTILCAITAQHILCMCAHSFLFESLTFDLAAVSCPVIAILGSQTCPYFMFCHV